MSLSSVFSQFADKAQSAFNPSSAAGKQPSANQAAAQGGHRSHALETLQHQIRAFGQQYTNTTPVQRIITAEKGVALDVDSLARSSKAQSKELYSWGQEEAVDLKDVTDRLAYMNYIQGTLADTLANKLDTARQPLKALRNAEAALAPKRSECVALENRIGHLEHSQDRNAEHRLSELRKQLAHAEHAKESQEKEILILKRKGVKDSERVKWDAIREFAEKLLLLSQAASPVIDALPIVPSTPERPYTGAEKTAEARAALQMALDKYTPGQTRLPQLGADLSRSDTRSFGESHASELSSIISTPTGEPVRPSIPVTPPPDQAPLQDRTPSPIDPHTLNLSPAPLPVRHPSSTTAAMPLAAQLTSEQAYMVQSPEATPTVAETGVPLSAGPSGPGPASGSLKDVRAQSREGSIDNLYAQPAGGEIKRPEREGQDHAPVSKSSTVQPESAADEKKRLEVEEQERVRAAREALDGQKDEELPPYKDFEE